jgi:hypothetical protein
MATKMLKSLYQIAVSILGILLVYLRRSSIFSNNPTNIDVLLLSLACVLIIVPLVKEISLGGITLKAELENTKKELTEKLSQFRNEIVSSIAISPTFNVGSLPLQDKAITNLTSTFEKTVNDAFQKYSEKKQAKHIDLKEIDSSTQFLFATRYNIEKELRRIWSNRESEKESKWPVTVQYITERLSRSGVIPENFHGAVREVYNICSPAIHGEAVSSAQVKFVKMLSSKIISTLKNID